jgi:ketosteroid isomerase-like protein
MKHAIFSSLATLCLMAMNGASLTPAASTDRSHAVITDRARALSAAVEAGDSAAAAQIFTRDAMLSTSGPGGMAAGRAAIQALWQSAFQGGVKGLELLPSGFEGSGDLKVETGTYRVLGASQAELMRGDYLIVWKKEEGTWRIHRDFASATAMPPAASPGAAADRVGFPRDYTTVFRLLGVGTGNSSPEIMTTYANRLAASVTREDQLPFPNGSIIAMEFATASRDGEGQMLRDSKGQPLKGEIVRVDVMRREAGFGEAYGEARAGEWEFASYRPDGTALITPDKATHCAACHRKVGAGKDFVHRLRPVVTALDMRPPCSMSSVPLAR